MNKVKEFFKKYVNITKIMQVWNYDITAKEVEEVFTNLDTDKNGKLQLKDLILKLVEKVIKQQL